MALLHPKISISPQRYLPETFRSTTVLNPKLLLTALGQSLPLNWDVLSLIIWSGSIWLGKLWRVTFSSCPFQTLMVNELMSESNQSGVWCLFLDHFKRLNSRDLNFQQWISRVCDKRFEFCFLFWQLSDHCELWKGSWMLVVVCLRVWECS